MPKDVCDTLPWIAGTQEIKVWLLMGSFGRCRVLSERDIAADTGAIELIGKISVIDAQLAPLEFDSEADAMFGYRIFESRLTNSTSKGHSQWRLRLPRALIRLWRLEPSQNDVAIRLWAGYIELWEINELKSAWRFPLGDFL
jgi:hypothetical protein